MNVELFIHGVPQGQKAWGKDDDRDYINNLYTKATENTKFLIELRTVKGKNYCYYSYLKYNNVVASDGREGSYFGLSLRFDQYCVHALRMYQLLEIVYGRYIVNTLLAEGAGRIKFLVSDFDSKDKEIKEIETVVMSLLQQSFFIESDFQSLASQPIASSGKTSFISLYDCTDENVRNAIKSSMKVSISNDYPTYKEQKMQQEMENKQKSFANSKENEIRGLGSTIDDLRSRNDKQSAENKALKQQIEQLKQQIENLNRQCKELDKRKTIEQLIAEIKTPLSNLQEPLNKLAAYVKTPVAPVKPGKPTPPNRKNGDEDCEEDEERKNGSRFKFVLIGICCLIILALIILSYCKLDTIFPKDDDKQQPQKVQQQPEPTDNYKIDLKGYKGTGKLQKDSTYIVTLQPREKDVEWTIEGVDEADQEKSNDTLRITIKEEGKKVIIKCIKGGKELSKRELDS